MNNSERLRFTEITEKDAENIVAWRSDPNVYQYFVFAHKITLEEHLKWYNERYLQDDTRVDYIACLQNTEEPIGVFGIKKVDGESAEVNYLLKPVAQGKGYAKEAVSWLMEEAARKWGVHTAIAEIHEGNLPSVRLVEKMGFQRKNKQGHFITYKKRI